ncbi:MFS general substrate transporter [Earliella scabrosa]|nr:MFS general substrate transporter [Earliella scabrosa]
MTTETEETRPLLDEEEGSRARKPTPLPMGQIAILMVLQLAEPITSHCIYPFINQLISELDITGGDEKKVGYYAGLIESIFYATEAMFVFHWSRLSDHIGRKPVLLIGLSGLCISMLLFGLSRTFWALVVSRSLVGMLNGNTGVMKSMIGELTDSTNIAQGFALIPIAWATGTTFGPLMGGQLSKPHDRWPWLFSHPFWIKFPYFLPCAAAAVFSAFAFLLTAVFLKETVVRRCSQTESALSDDALPSSPDDAPPPLRAILTRPVLLSIANYGALALVNIAFFALVPLFLATPIALGGLGLLPSTIGVILGGLGLVDGTLQALLFSKTIDRWGAKRVFQVGMLVLIPMYTLFPTMSAYAKAHGGLSAVVWALLSLQMLLFVVMDSAFGASYIFVSSSAPDNRCLGAVNGIAQLIGSVTRAIGPAVSTSLFATSLERNWLGGYAVYPILVVFSFLLFFASIPLPRRMWPKEDPRAGIE